MLLITSFTFNACLIESNEADIEPRYPYTLIGMPHDIDELVLSSRTFTKNGEIVIDSDSYISNKLRELIQDLNVYDSIIIRNDTIADIYMNHDNSLYNASYRKLKGDTLLFMSSDYGMPFCSGIPEPDEICTIFFAYGDVRTQLYIPFSVMYRVQGEDRVGSKHNVPFGHYPLLDQLKEKDTLSFLNVWARYER